MSECQTIQHSANRNGRFEDGTVLLDIFEGIVEQCKKAGLVQGQAAVTASTHVKANASDESRELVTVTKTPRDYLQTLEAAAEELNQELREKRGRNKRGRKGGGALPERTEVRSTTDPDAGLLNRPGKPKGFHYLAHITIEPTHGIILDAMAPPANVTDHEPYVECIRRTKKRHEIREDHKIYATKQTECKTCPLRTQCLSATRQFRQLKRPFHQEALDEAHARIGSPRYRELQRQRRVWCEGTNAHLKAPYCLQRAMRRGLN